MKNKFLYHSPQQIPTLPLLDPMPLLDAPTFYILLSHFYQCETDRANYKLQETPF